MTKHPVDLNNCYIDWLDKDTILLAIDEELGNDPTDETRIALSCELWTNEDDAVHITWQDEDDIFSCSEEDLADFGLSTEIIRNYLLAYKAQNHYQNAN